MPKPRQFQYRPLYYDERKERLEKIKARAEAEFAAKKEGVRYTGLEKGFLTEQRANSKFKHHALEPKSTLRFLVILVLVIGMLYLLMPDLFIAMWKGK